MTSPDDRADLEARLARAERRAERERTTRLESEKIAEEALSRLYEANQAKSTFLATISHELRTPLTSIVGFTSLLLASWDSFGDEMKLDFLHRIDRNGQLLHDMIEEVLEFTRLESETLSARVAVGPLERSVSHAVERHRAMLVEHELRVDLDAVEARFDHDAVVRIIRNLLSNAVRYAPKHSTITVRLRTRDDRAVLEVIDEGPGVPGEEVERVFEPFYRGRQPHVIATHGSGIGLTVCRRFVEMMGGEIRLVPNEPTGTRAVVSLLRPR